MADLIPEIARLVTGLNVPMSLGLPLGTAKESWSAIRDDLRLFGYQSAEEVEAILRAKYALVPVDDLKTVLEHLRTDENHNDAEEAASRIWAVL